MTSLKIGWIRDLTDDVRAAILDQIERDNPKAVRGKFEKIIRKNEPILITHVDQATNRVTLRGDKWRITVDAALAEKTEPYIVDPRRNRVR